MFANRFFDRARMTRILCIALALSIGAPLARAADDRHAAAENPAGKKPSTPDDIRMAAASRLDRALGESSDAIKARLKALEEFFAERKAGARPFAQAVLGMEGKGRAAASFGAMAIGGIAGLLGEKPQAPPDALTPYVRQRFRALVLDPEQVKQAIEDAMSGFLGDLTEIEGRLLVDLRADIGDSMLDLRGAMPDVRAEAAAGGQHEAIISDTLDTASKDLAVSLGMFVVSNFLGGKLADQVTPQDAPPAVQFMASLLTGVAVDKALDQAARQAGYDAEGSVVAKTTAGIDRIRTLVIDGDPNAVPRYVALYRLREQHPNAEVRATCGQAVDVLERTTNLGLRNRLVMLHNERSRRRTAVLTAHLFGPEAAKTRVSLYSPLDPKDVPPATNVIRYAQETIALYGGSN